MAAEAAARAGAAAPAAALGEDDGAPAALREALADVVAGLAPQVVALSHDIHVHPEVGYREHHAVAAVADILRAHGLEAEVGVYGMDTALRAAIGPGAPDDDSPGAPDGAGPDAVSGAPTIAILAEYDALPGIGHAPTLDEPGVQGAIERLLVRAAREPAAA